MSFLGGGRSLHWAALWEGPAPGLRAPSWGRTGPRSTLLLSLLQGRVASPPISSLFQAESVGGQTMTISQGTGLMSS